MGSPFRFSGLPSWAVLGLLSGLKPVPWLRFCRRAVPLRRCPSLVGVRATAGGAQGQVDSPLRRTDAVDHRRSYPPAEQPRWVF